MSTFTEAKRMSKHGIEPKPIAERFWQNVIPEPNSGCWLWTGHYNSKGYGRLTIGSVVDGSARHALAHRLSYEMHLGPIPQGLELDHKCRVTACVNPQHLEAVTHAVNIKRSPLGSVATNAAARAQKEKTHCKRGHPLSGDNVHISTSGGKNKRQCKTCRRELSRMRAPTVAERLRARKASDPEFAARRRAYKTEWSRQNRKQKDPS